MTEYPFIIRGPTRASRKKLVKVTALTLKLAMAKILALFPIKFVNTKFARNMDLISAKQLAVKQSNAKPGKIVYIIVDEKDGECDLANAPLRGVYTAYKNGSEIALVSPTQVTIEPKGKKRKITEREFESEKGKLTPKASTKQNAPTAIQGAKTNTTMADKKKPASKPTPKAKPEGTGKATTLILSSAQWAKVEKLTEKEGSIREMVAKAMIKTYSL